jgi:hypothetical protein
LSPAVCAPPLSLATSSVARLSPRREVTGRPKRRSRFVFGVSASHPLESVCCLLLCSVATSAALSILVGRSTLLHLLFLRRRLAIPRAFAYMLCVFSFFSSCPASWCRVISSLSCSPLLCLRWLMAIPIVCVDLSGGLASGALLRYGDVACPPWGRFSCCLLVPSTPSRHRPMTHPPSTLSSCACLVPVRTLAL